ATNPEALHAAKAELGLDKPKWQQYFIFLGQLARGDLGRSFETRRSTWTELGERVPCTVELVVLIAFVACSGGLAVGILSALDRASWIDYVLRFISILAVAAPVFFIAIVMTFFVLKYHLWTIENVGKPRLWTDPKAAFFKYLIPALAGGLAGGAAIMRLLRS